MTSLFAALLLSSSALAKDDPKLVALFDKLYMVYCEKGTRAVDRPRALEVAREALRGEYKAEDFLAFWSATCSYNESRELAREAGKGSVSPRLFTEAVARKCKEGHALRPEDAMEFARAGARGEVISEDFFREWDSSCRFLDSLRKARHAKLLKGKEGKFTPQRPGAPDPEKAAVPEVH